jgi:transposase-like protein
VAERKAHDEATKAAVMVALLAGQSVSEIAKEYNINPATISSWKSRMRNGDNLAVLASEKKEQIGDLLFDYAETMLRTLKKQAEHFSDKPWLTRQSADALAILHGVSLDKVIRLLEAVTSRDTDTGTDT